MFQRERPVPATPWVMRRPRPAAAPPARLRLFCLPYAGGSASIFRAWPPGLPREVEVCAVQPPGRGNRLGEAPFVRLDDLLPPLVDAVLPLLDLPYAFFGHSLGALVALELARRLRSRVGTQPAVLLVSACRAPQLPDHASPIHELPEDRFLARLREVNGIPVEVLENRDLLDLLLPLLRADVEMAETYRWQPGTPLGCRITAVGSDGDPFVSRADVDAWRVHTTGAFSARTLPGAHFFIHTAESELLEFITGELRPFLTLDRARAAG